MLPTFQRALQRRTAIVSGVKLPPHTLAKAYCLYAFESPVVTGEVVTPSDFSFALWVCTQKCYPFPAFVDSVCSEKPDRFVKRLGKRYDLKQYHTDCADLREYLAWHTHVPVRYMKEKPKFGASAPWPMIIAVQLIPLLGEERTWTMPLPLAMSYKIALDNSAGDTSWKSEELERQGYANGGQTTSG